MQRYRELRARLRGERLSLATRRAGADTAAQACSVLAVFGAFAFVAVRALQGHNTIGDVVMCLQAFQRIQGALVELLRSLAGLYEDNLFLGNLYEFLDLEPTVTDPPEPVPAPERLTSGIALEHVSFRYPGAGRSVLSDVTVTIRPGQVVALVGENGSGKTTLVKLLCRLHDPTSGVVRLDGTDLRDFAVADVRALFSIIFQDYAHYHFTVRENIRFGDLRAPDDDGRVEAAAALAGADQVVERLPQGYETTLGKWFPEGEELSIGEWQKIALARAFMRDSAVVVLDEPTSALDAKAEAEVFARFRALVKERTAILVSHRFSTVRLADCIYVLADGRVTETGSHDELMALGGTYARLFELQAQSYR